MSQAAYERNLAARAFDVARYLLPFGVPTNIGQVTSIRTLERQIRRMKASEYAEMRQLGDETAQACAAKPECLWDAASTEPIAPTLAKYVNADEHLAQSRRDLKLWAQQNLPTLPEAVEDIHLMRPTELAPDIVATLLYPVTHAPYRSLYELAAGWSAAQRAEVIGVATKSRGKHDDLLTNFRGGLYVYDMVMDVGAYRDLHRHRRCQQFRQAYDGRLGWATPDGAPDFYRAAMASAWQAMKSLPEPGSHYLLPFAARGRFLFKMDFAEAQYIARLRSGVKGHFSYRRVAWAMKERMEQLEPELAHLMAGTPPWEEDPLTR